MDGISLSNATLQSLLRFYKVEAVYAGASLKMIDRWRTAQLLVYGAGKNDYNQT